MSEIKIIGRDAEGFLILRRTPIFVQEILQNNGGGGGNVVSVNGKIGVVVLTATDVGAYPNTNPSNFINASQAPVQSVNGQTGVVVLDATSVGAYPNTNPSNFINASQAPVQSVAGKTGVVTLVKGDVGLGNVDNTSDLNKPISTSTQTALDGKVDKVVGKGLSDENYTLTEKQKLAGIAAGAQVNTVTSVNTQTGAVVLDATSVGAYPNTNPSNFITAAQAPVQSVNGQTGVVTLNLFSGDYDDLTNKPTIPTLTSQLTNDSGFITSAPVTSVNGQTGVVVLNATSVGAYPDNNPSNFVNAAGAAAAAPVQSVNGQTGTVTISSLPPSGNAGGDLTGTYPNPTIANNAVTTAKILDSNVTLAKIENIGNAKLLGRHSSGNGVVQTIGIDGGLELQGANLRREALTGDVTATAGSNTTTIANGAVTAAKTSSGVQASLALADTSLQPTTAATGAVIDFVSSKVFNSPSSPATGNITDNLTGAKIGVVQKVYHNSGTAPTVPAGWVLLGSGTYTISVLNIIYAEFVGSSRVEYWIVQQA